MELEAMPRRKKPVQPLETGRVTYRDLRNTPGRVFERLAEDEPLTLVADGVPRALLIPISDGDVATARDAYVRGRALLALRRIQDRARREGTDRLTLGDINRMIREVRCERAREDQG
jgi:antitoxin (DNA-binding transcriptional repressor) of toxin-antitoxin stability system